MQYILIGLASVGFCVSLYTYFVERKIKAEPDYKPACDLSDTVSCSKPMKSIYANLFFVSNAVIGMGFYVLVIILTLLHAYTLLFLAIVGSCIASCILAYILYTKIKSFCILCTSVYVINFLLLIATLSIV